MKSTRIQSPVQPNVVPALPALGSTCGHASARGKPKCGGALAPSYPSASCWRFQQHQELLHLRSAAGACGRVLSKRAGRRVRVSLASVGCQHYKGAGAVFQSSLQDLQDPSDFFVLVEQEAPGCALLSWPCALPLLPDPAKHRLDPAPLICFHHLVHSPGCLLQASRTLFGSGDVPRNLGHVSCKM